MRCGGAAGEHLLRARQMRQPDRDGLDRGGVRLRLGATQLVTGRLSDHVGRFWPIVLGMWICGAGIALNAVVGFALWWAVSEGSRDSAWRCCIRSSARRSRTSRHQVGVDLSAFFASDGIWVLGSGLLVSDLPPIWRGR